MKPVPEILQLSAVRKSYGLGELSTEVLHGVDVHLNAGEFVALVGPSGSGKSTLLNIIGLLERPSAGTVRVCGEETATLDDAGLTRLRGRSLGFVFQFHHLLPAFTALENVCMPSLIDRGYPDAELQAQAMALLDRVGLHDHAHKTPGKLSGGQQQRVAIARALAMRAPLVLADEPTGNLDTQTAHEIFSLLRQVNQTQGTAFLIVTHDPQLASRCDRRIDLVDGRIVTPPA